MVSDIEVVRRFNRTVTQRIGALNEEYLARQRPMGASRVLWEISEGGVDVRALRRRLELDSGYLSRLLRKLEIEGLVTVNAASQDGRVRLIRLTAEGEAERAVLDSHSNDLARSLLASLDSSRQQQLIAAMATVERLLVAGLVTVSVQDPETADAEFCLGEYFAELNKRFDSGFDPAASISAAADELRPPHGLLLVARLRSEPVGCGALKWHGNAPTEIKRMWIAESTRGLGLGRRILVELEAQATRMGATTVRLETNRALNEAIVLYRSSGYHEVDPFNDEPYANHWFEKHL